MDKNDFRISGFARFYRSLLRFFDGPGNRSVNALKTTYNLYAAVIEAYRKRAASHEKINEKNKEDFYKAIKQAEVKPYRTEVQLYRAMEAVYFHIGFGEISGKQFSAVVHLMNMMSDIEIRFYKAFDMEIQDDRTVYDKCAGGLVPRADEPGLCILQDWLDTLPA